MNTSLASIQDIAAMKLEALGTRGKKRDFIDLYFICNKGHSLNDVFAWYRKKFKGINVNLVHYAKALTYFEEAEADPMPQVLKQVSWSHVKKFFETEAPEILTVIE